jgi:hypothetical protein
MVWVETNKRGFVMSICSSCYEECSEVEIKDGFYYDYGSITGAWHDESYAGSSCCGEPVLEGCIFLEKSGRCIARKDHEERIKKGDLYRWSLKKGYYIDDDGKHEPIYEYSKILIMRAEELANGIWKPLKHWMFKWQCKECDKKYSTLPQDRKCPECERIKQEAMQLIGEVEV